MASKKMDGTRYTGYVTQMTVYEVRGDHDQSEGRGGTYTVGWFTDPDLANKAANGKGVWGEPGTVRKRTEDVVVFEKDGEVRVGLIQEFISIETENPDEVRERALAKLTPHEKELLGLK